jgi:cell division protein FtsA
MLVDLGADTTTIVVYHKNIVRHVAVIPLGSNSITKDLCALQLEDQDAEKLKTKYASAFTPENEIDGEEQYNLSPSVSVPAVKVIDLVEARVDEIITNAWNQVPAEFAEKLLGGIILTGGGAQLKNIIQAFRKITNIEQIRIAKDSNEAFTPQPIVPTSFTHNTLVGILAKGDQNCWAEAAAPRTNTDMFNTAATTPAAEEKKTGETMIPISGLQTFDGAGSTNIEIKQKDDLNKEEDKKQKEVPDSEEDRLIKQYREQQEKRKGKDSDSLGNKISRWFQSLTNPEE